MISTTSGQATLDDSQQYLQQLTSSSTLLQSGGLVTLDDSFASSHSAGVPSSMHGQPKSAENSQSRGSKYFSS